MEKRVLLLVDIKNLFYAVRKKFPEKGLDYEMLLNHVKATLGTDNVSARAYGMQVEKEAQPFIGKLEALGYDVHYRQRRFSSSTWNCGMTVDALNICSRVETVVIASADNDLLPLMDELRRRGIEVVVIGCSLSRDIRQVANKTIEIEETLLISDKGTN